MDSAPDCAFGAVQSCNMGFSVTAALAESVSNDMQQPPLGWTTTGRVTRLIDGDTMVVELRRQIHVRVRDCWCPESRTRDSGEKEKGLAAKRYGQSLLEKVGKEVVLHIDAAHEGDLARVLTLGRVLGRVWLADGREYAEVMRKAGHATKEKEP